MINIKQKFDGFVKTNKRSNSKLHIIKNIEELFDLLPNKSINVIKKIMVEEKIFYLETPYSEICNAFVLLKPSYEFRKSTLDKSARIANSLPDRIWDVNFSKKFEESEIFDFLFGWGLSFYKFNLNEKILQKKSINILSLKYFSSKLLKKCREELRSIFIARNLINLPANILNPNEYEKQIIKLFKNSKTKIKIFKGKNFDKNFPLIHLVGRASEFEPRLIDITYKNNKNKNNKEIVIIGKGVTFDSGGLDIKTSSSMLLMKKDMAGSAIALAIFRTLVEQKINLNLRLILPIAENAISSKSMRPGDIVFSKNNTLVEIGNTDAEGRLLLADALSYSQENNLRPILIFDFATLTGAARIALGTELPALFSNNRSISKKIIENSLICVDPIWELPLFSPYERFLKNKDGSLSSTGNNATGGAITAALFLQNFINKRNDWVHIDLMGWNLDGRPGFPKGGEAMSFKTILKTIIDLTED